MSRVEKGLRQQRSTLPRLGRKQWITIPSLSRNISRKTIATRTHVRYYPHTEHELCLVRLDGFRAKMKVKTMNYNNFRIADELTDFEQFSAGEDRVVIDFDGTTKTIHTFTSGNTESLYSGESMEEARKSLELSEQDWNDLLMSDVQYLEPRA